MGTGKRPEESKEAEAETQHQQPQAAVVTPSELLSTDQGLHLGSLHHNHLIFELLCRILSPPQSADPGHSKQAEQGQLL